MIIKIFLLKFCLLCLVVNGILCMIVILFLVFFGIKMKLMEWGCGFFL